MNSAEIWVLVGGLAINLFGLLLTLLAIAFYAGKFSESSRLHEKRMDKLEGKIFNGKGE